MQSPVLALLGAGRVGRGPGQARQDAGGPGDAGLVSSELCLLVPVLRLQNETGSQQLPDGHTSEFLGSEFFIFYTQWIFRI